jgi:hypothetical protein
MNVKIQRAILLIMAITALSLLWGGCVSSVPTVTFDQLISQADRYQGRTVTLEAYYFAGFEISALCGAVGPANSGPWRIVPSGTLIWVAGGIPLDLFNQLYTQSETPSGYPERIGRLRVTGVFETGARYGHLDAYDYQINVTAAQLLEWSPPPAS